MTTKLQSNCRLALASLRTGSRRRSDFGADVLAVLEYRGLISEHTEGLVEATPRAAGYCADPSTFDAHDGPRIIGPVTTDGWYKMDDGRFALVAWVDGQPKTTAVTDDVAAYEAKWDAAYETHMEADHDPMVDPRI